MAKSLQQTKKRAFQIATPRPPPLPPPPSTYHNARSSPTTAMPTPPPPTSATTTVTTESKTPLQVKTRSLHRPKGVRSPNTGLTSQTVSGIAPRRHKRRSMQQQTINPKNQKKRQETYHIRRQKGAACNNKPSQKTDKQKINKQIPLQTIPETRQTDKKRIIQCEHTPCSWSKRARGEGVRSCRGTERSP